MQQQWACFQHLLPLRCSQGLKRLQRCDPIWYSKLQYVIAASSCHITEFGSRVCRAFESFGHQTRQRKLTSHRVISRESTHIRTIKQESRQTSSSDTNLHELFGGHYQQSSTHHSFVSNRNPSFKRSIPKLSCLPHNNLIWVSMSMASPAPTTQ